MLNWKLEVSLPAGTQYTVMRDSQNGSFFAVPSPSLNEGGVPSLEEGEIPTEDTQRLSLEEGGALECHCMASGDGTVGFDAQGTLSSEGGLRHWGGPASVDNSNPPPTQVAMDTRDTKYNGSLGMKYYCGATPLSLVQKTVQGTHL